MLARSNIFSAVIGVLGFLTSLYALIVHIGQQMGSGGAALCDISQTVSCTQVMGSSYGEFLAIPWGAYGMAYFSIILVTALVPKWVVGYNLWQRSLELLVGVVGLGVVGILLYISYGVLGAVCPTCSVIHGLVILYFLGALLKFIQAKRSSSVFVDFQEAPQRGVFLSRWLGACLIFALPPLLIGLLVPLLIHFLGPKPTAAASIPAPASSAVVEEPVKAPENPLRAALMTFNKTNFVGNGEDYRRGYDTAPVVVQIFSDFGCPHCRSSSESLSKAQDVVGLENVLVVYRFFPLSQGCNSFVPAAGWYPVTCILTEAVRCAGQQGQFWAFKDWAFTGQDWTDAERAQRFAPEALKNKAQTMGLNGDTFGACLASGVEKQKIQDDAALANQLGIRGTPMIFINGEEYRGSNDTASFVRVFQEILSVVVPHGRHVH